MAPREVMKVKNLEVSFQTINEKDFISLTDIAKHKDSQRTNYIIQNWMRTRSTIEFIGFWELLNNPSFKGIEFDAFKNQAGSNAIAQLKSLADNSSIKKLESGSDTKS